jgi:hypothetical protein
MVRCRPHAGLVCGVKVKKSFKTQSYIVKMTEFNNYIVKGPKLVSKVHRNVKLVQTQKLYRVQLKHATKIVKLVKIPLQTQRKSLVGQIPGCLAGARSMVRCWPRIGPACGVKVKKSFKTQSYIAKMTEFNNYIVKMSKLATKVHRNVNLYKTQKIVQSSTKTRNKNRKTC